MLFKVKKLKFNVSYNCKDSDDVQVECFIMNLVNQFSKYLKKYASNTNFAIMVISTEPKNVEIDIKFQKNISVKTVIDILGKYQTESSIKVSEFIFDSEKMELTAKLEIEQK